MSTQNVTRPGADDDAPLGATSRASSRVRPTADRVRIAELESELLRTRALVVEREKWAADAEACAPPGEHALSYVPLRIDKVSTSQLRTRLNCSTFAKVSR